MRVASHISALVIVVPWLAACASGSSDPLDPSATVTPAPGVTPSPGSNESVCPAGRADVSTDRDDGGAMSFTSDGGHVTNNVGAEPSNADFADRTLGEVYADAFPIGAAIAQSHLNGRERAVLAREFNHFTAENDMKFESLHPTESQFNFSAADAIAAFAREQGARLTGHTLVWHRQNPTWLFANLKERDAGSIETLKSRLQAHIQTVITRYNDVVDNWDVVNEAISDSTDHPYRNADEGSDWYRIVGSADYVTWAFQFAYQALESIAPGNAAGKLYYNDYNETVKVDRIITLLDGVRAAGVPVDGVGLQGHYRIGWPAPADLATTIDKLTDAGYRVKLSELDVSVYDDYGSGTFRGAPEVDCSAELALAQAKYYGEIFDVLLARREHVSSVTFWGISDDRTWLDGEPVAGRNNYPLLWNDRLEPKAAYFSVLEAK